MGKNALSNKINEIERKIGETVAQSIVEARNHRPFSSKKDFELRTSINKKQYANLIKLEAFGDLVDDDTTLL